MRRRTRVAIAAGVAAAAALVVPRAAVRTAWSNLRRYSAPAARPYEVLAGSLLGGLYDHVAGDVAGICPDGTVLEVGPGPGHLAVAIARRTPGVEVVGVDIDPAMVARARARAERAGLAARVRFEIAEVAEIPLPDESVDLAVSTFSLHHWLDPVSGLDEIHRVLRPGGRALILDLPRAWTRFETSGPSAAEAAAQSAFRGGPPERYRWPLGLPLLIRLDLIRLDLVRSRDAS